MERSKEKSEDLAMKLELAKIYLFQIDLEYAHFAASEIRKDASWTDSTAALNRNYDPKKSQILYTQADALMCLVDFINGLKDVQKLKDELKVMDDFQAKMFPQ